MTPEISISLQRESFSAGAEREQTKSAGIALLIVGLDKTRDGDNRINPLFWTIKELEDKPDTKKKKGDLSIPAETRKTGETREMNLLGALAEFCDDESLPYVRQHLFLAEGLFRQKCININGNLVDVSVLIYDGDLEYPIIPLNNTEVSANTWLSRNQIKSAGNVRLVLTQAIEIDMQEELSKSIVDIYNTNSSVLKPVFSENIKTMADYYQTRERVGDIPLIKPEVLS